MRRSICSGLSGFSLLALPLAAFLCTSCVPRGIPPVNEGREYGDPVPIMVSHLGKGSPHYFLQNIVCFDYGCRKGNGKRKAMRAISFEDYKKRIRKNAKKGVYKKTTPAVKTVKPDTIVIKKKAVIAAKPVVAEEVTPPESSVVAPILKADSLIILSEFLFETNSYKLKGEHFAALDSIAKFLSVHPTLEVFVSGHTDSIGNEHHNVALSTRRAEGVADYLVNAGAPDERVRFEGFGSSRPIASNRMAKGRGKNRRVEILISNSLKR